jgi:hypothetical protein
MKSDPWVNSEPALLSRSPDLPQLLSSVQLALGFLELPFKAAFSTPARLAPSAARDLQQPAQPAAGRFR